MSDPIKNLRITIWGAQGSLQWFPDSEQVDEYADIVGTDVLFRAFEDARARFGEKGFTLVDLLEAPLSPESVQRYFRRVGRIQPPIYSGETTCVEVETAEGNVIVLDGGSGIRHFAKRRIQKWADREERVVTLLGTHDHLDHRIGLPFSAICFARPNFRLNVYGNYRFLAALDERFAMFSRNITPACHRDDPLDYRMMAAEFVGTQIVSPDEALETEARLPNCVVHAAAEPIRVGKTRITAFPVYHASTPCLAYKFEHGDASFLFCTDHEFRHTNDPTHPDQIRSEAAEARLRKMCQNVDAAYFDGQYRLNEYLGEVGLGGAPGIPRIDWGHSCIEDIIDRAHECQIRHTLIGHHDPDRTGGERTALDLEVQEMGRQSGRQIELAKARQVVDL